MAVCGPSKHVFNVSLKNNNNKYHLFGTDPYSLANNTLYEWMMIFFFLRGGICDGSLEGEYIYISKDE